VVVRDRVGRRLDQLVRADQLADLEIGLLVDEAGARRDHGVRDLDPVAARRCVVSAEVDAAHRAAKRDHGLPRELQHVQRIAQVAAGRLRQAAIREAGEHEVDDLRVGDRGGRGVAALDRAEHRAAADAVLGANGRQPLRADDPLTELGERVGVQIAGKEDRDQRRMRHHRPPEMR
jgi:hypothetical protein